MNRRLHPWLTALQLFALIALLLGAMPADAKKKKAEDKAEEEKKDEKWDVTAPKGAAFYDVEIDVEEEMEDGDVINVHIAQNGMITRFSQDTTGPGCAFLNSPGECTEHRRAPV